MSFEEKEEPKSLLPVMIGVEAVLGLVVALFFIFSRGCESPGNSSVSRPVVFQKRSASARPASPTAARAAPSPSPDVLPWLVRENAPQYASGDSEKASGPAAAAAPAANPGAPAAPPVLDPLSAEDSAALKAAAGPWGAEKAREIGGKRGLLFRLGENLLSHPKLVGLVLNNDYVVGGFMSQDRVRRNCSDERSLANYLSDTKDSSGISLGLASIGNSLNTPDSARALFGSKLVATVLSKCGSIKALMGDPPALGAVATANSQLVSMMMDARLINALGASPAAIRTLNRAQSSLSVQAVPAP